MSGVLARHGGRDGETNTRGLRGEYGPAKNGGTEVRREERGEKDFEEKE